MSPLPVGIAAIPYSPHVQTVVVLLGCALAVASFSLKTTSNSEAWRPLQGLPTTERRRIHALARGGRHVPDPADAELAKAHALAWLRTFGTSRYRLRMRLLMLSMVVCLGYPFAVRVSRSDWGRPIIVIVWLALCAAGLRWRERITGDVRSTVLVNDWADDAAVVGER
jgi:hypothetical protein